MVFQRRLDYGFNGYQVPLVPRAPRSAGGRGPIRKKSENNQRHAFEILVSVAGEILQEETSAPTNSACGKDLCNVKNTIQQEQVDRGKFLIVEPLLGEPCDEKAFACIRELQGHWHGNALNKFLHNQESFNSQGSLASERFDYSETIYAAEKLVVLNSKNAGRSPCEMNEKSSHAWKIFNGKVEGLIERKPEAGLVKRNSIESRTLLVKDGSFYLREFLRLLSFYHPVKLGIKSFKVPELFIEIPATATVGSLKGTVMKAITAILGDGLHVGILLQGKKVKDDNRTMLQTGISENDKHSNLGFMLEPRHAKMMSPPHTKKPSNLSVSAPGGITRHTTSSMLQAGTSHAFPVPPETNFSSSVGSDLGEVCSHPRLQLLIRCQIHELCFQFLQLAGVHYLQFPLTANLCILSLDSAGSGGHLQFQR